MFRMLTTKCHRSMFHFINFSRHFSHFSLSTGDYWWVRCCYNFKLFDKVKMPPKRKATTVTTVIEKPDSTTDIVKPTKRGKKAELLTNGNQNDEDQVHSPPKRSRPVRSTKTVVSYDETKIPQESKNKPKPKKTLKTDKPSTTSKSPQPGPSWRVTPDPDPKESEKNITVRKPNKQKEETSTEKTEKSEKSKPKKKTAKTKKAKLDEILENGDAKEKEKTKPKAVEEQNGDVEKGKSKPKKTKTKAVEEQNGDVEKETSKTKKTKTKAVEKQNGDVEKETSIAKKTKTKAVEEQNGDIEKDNEPKVKELLNKTDTQWNDINFSCEKKNGWFGVSHNLIISTWNVGGIKSWVKKGCMEYLEHERPDILCMQETKCTKEKLPEELSQLKGYHQYWCSSDKEGYAGVGLLSITEPKNVTYGIKNENQDAEGRCITAEFDKFYLVNVYVPNAGRKLVTMPKRLEWNKAFKQYVKDLEEKKPVIICGDMNVSHNAIDLARPQSNTKNAGFTKEEREGMTELLNDGLVDIYRHLYPDQKDVYSFWTYMSNSRAKNVGWRLDYFIVSEDMIKGVMDVVYRTEVFGSDHCPVTMFINV